jgi:hypothetical protein
MDGPSPDLQAAATSVAALVGRARGVPQRVVLYHKGERPHLKVSVVTVLLAKIDVVSWCRQ